MRASSAVAILFLCACGGEPPKAAAPPTTESAAPPPFAAASASGAKTVAVAGPVDPALPAGAAWLAAFDTHELAALLADKGVAALASSALGADVSAVAQIGLDPGRPILLAESGLGEAERAALAKLLATGGGGGGAGDDAGKLLAETMRATPFAASFRAVLPVSDVARATDAVGKLLAAAGLRAERDGVYTSRRVRVEVSSAPGVVVADFALSLHPEDAVAALRAAVRAGHAEPPALAPGEAVHVTYRPSELAEIAALSELEMAAGAISGASIDPSQRARIAHEAMDEDNGIVTLLGPRAAPAVDHVDVSARRDGKGLAFEIRAEPGPAWRAPPGDAWKPSPSFAPDGPDGFFTFSRPFVSAWPLAGDPPGAPLTKSPAAQAVAGGPIGLLAGLPLGAPVVGRLAAHAAGFPEAAYARFDRFGEVLPSDGSTVKVALFAKATKATEAACVFAPKAPCAAKEQIKIDAPATATATASPSPSTGRFVRVVHVKGTTALAAMTSSSKAALDAIHLHASDAGPVDVSLPSRVGGAGGFDVPWLTEGQRVVLTLGLDGKTEVAKIGTPP